MIYSGSHRCMKQNLPDQVFTQENPYSQKGMCCFPLHGCITISSCYLPHLTQTDDSHQEQGPQSFFNGRVINYHTLIMLDTVVLSLSDSLLHGCISSVWFEVLKYSTYTLIIKLNKMPLYSLGLLQSKQNHFVIHTVIPCDLNLDHTLE